MSKFCTNCGSTIEDNAGFCTVCGAPAPAEMPVQQPLQPSDPQPYQPMRQSAPQRNYATPDNAGAHPAPYTAPDAPGTSDSRSHLGLGIGITVAIVLLIAALITAVILTIFVWKPWEKETPDGPQKILDQFGEYEMGTLGQQDYLNLYYEYHYTAESEKRTFIHSLAILPMEETRKERRERYGDDLSITMTITSQITLNGTERQEIIDYVGKYADTSRIEEIVRVYGNAEWKGSRDSQTSEFFSGDGMIFIKADGKWYASFYGFEKMRRSELPADYFNLIDS